MARPRKSVLLARELAEAPTGKLRQRFVKPFVLQRLCELASEKLSCGDQNALRVARLCCRVARLLETDEVRALSFAQLASALRQANRLEHAEQALDIAFDAAPNHLLGDVVRRRACIRIYQGKLPEAVKDARAALEKTFGQAKARSREALGVALFLSGEHQAGTREFERCLAETDPDCETDYCNAIQNYATALAQGTEEEMRQALKLCAKARSMLKRRHRMQRAKLWWTEGLIHEKLGDLQKAWWSLNNARRSLIALAAAPEVAAIVADMARVSPQPTAIREICHEAAALLAGGDPLRHSLCALGLAARELIPEAAAALRRQACTLAPCLAL